MLLLLITFLSAVDKSKYRQCKDSPFCARNRFVDIQNWQADPLTSKIEDSVYSLTLNDETYSNKLTLRLSFHDRNVVHYKISPTESESHSRYDCSAEPSVVDAAFLEQKNEITEIKNDTHISIKSSSSTTNTNTNTNTSSVAVVQLKPFMLTIFEDDIPKIVVNSDFKSIFETNINQELHPDHFKTANFSGYEETLVNGPSSVATTFQFFGNNLKFSGLPSHTLKTNLPSTINETDGNASTDPIRLFNTDTNEFETNSVMSNYGSIPYLIGHEGKLSTAVFWCNPSETWVDIDNKHSQTRFISETGFIDCYIIYGTHKDVINSYSKITGKPILPHIFSLGFHQSRWSYMSTKDVRIVQKHLDKQSIPHDSIWLDLDHTDNKKYFTFDPKNFADVKKLAKELAKNNRYLVALVDPHLKVERDYQTYYEAKSNGFFIKGKNKRDYIANCWPGRSGFVDFFNPEASEWWAGLYAFNQHRKASKNMFIWNDMNEPSVMKSAESTCPRDSIHHNGYENREVHNLYGQLMIRASYDGVLKRNRVPDERPFILTRSFFAGSQKYAFTWTGDNTADWDHLKSSIPMVLSLGIAGFPFSGSDVGGFFGSPNPDLLLRWYQVGAFCYPFFRTHCHHLSEKREPYNLKSEYIGYVKNSIQERYQLLPLWYTASFLSSRNGEPIVRPLWWEFDDPEAQTIDTQVLISDSILVVPFLSEAEEDIHAYLPKARWFEFRSLKEINKPGEMITVRFDKELVPLFIRGGKIVCTKPKLRKSAIQTIEDPFNMIVALDETGKASGEIYVDDGHTFNYTENNAKIYRKFEFDGTCLKSSEIEAANKESEFFNNYSALIDLIQITGLDKEPKGVKDQNGEDVEFTFSEGIAQIFPSINMKDDWSFTLQY